MLTFQQKQKGMNTLKLLKYKCNICDAAYKSGSALTYHIRVIHKEKLDYSCKICKVQFGDQLDLTQHVTNTHEENT